MSELQTVAKEASVASLWGSSLRSEAFIGTMAEAFWGTTHLWDSVERHIRGTVWILMSG